MRPIIAVLYLASFAPIAYPQSFSSLADFWNASPGKVDQRLHTRPLDLSRQLDRKVRSIMDELDRLSRVTTNVSMASNSRSS